MADWRANGTPYPYRTVYSRVSNPTPTKTMTQQCKSTCIPICYRYFKFLYVYECLYVCAYTSKAWIFQGRQMFCQSLVHSLGFQRHMLYTHTQKQDPYKWERMAYGSLNYQHYSTKQLQFSCCQLSFDHRHCIVHRPLRNGLLPNNVTEKSRMIRHVHMSCKNCETNQSTIGCC